MSNVTITATSTHPIADVEAFATLEGWTIESGISAVDFVSRLIQGIITDRISLHAVQQIVADGQAAIASSIASKKAEIAATVTVTAI